MNNRCGFTFFELILTVVVLGILSISALPLFYNVSSGARSTAVEGIVGNVHDALSIYRANELALVGSKALYPNSLDSNSFPDVCSTCFSNILSFGLNDPSWRKQSQNLYSVNDGTKIRFFSYDPGNGTFTEQ